MTSPHPNNSTLSDAASPSPGHGHTFEQHGRTYHLRIKSAADLRRAVDLDEALWVATSAPINTLHLDGIFLKFIDADEDGRIRAYEMTRAIEWATGVFANRAGLDEGRAVLCSHDVNAEHPDGRRIVEAIRKMIARSDTDVGEDACVTLKQVRAIKHLEQERAVSEAGVVLPEAAESEAITFFLEDIMRTVGGEPHPTGRTGVTQAKLDAFLSAARGLLDWRAKGHIPDGQAKTDIMPLGPRTPTAHGALQSVRAKIDQFFAQSEALVLDPSLATRFGLQPGDFFEKDLDKPEDITAVMRAAPLAPPSPDRVLRWNQQINPAYADALARFRTMVVQPVLGESPDALTEARWEQIKQTFAAYEAWLTDKTGGNVESLGEDKLRAYLEPRFADRVRALIDRSRQTAFVLDHLRAVEKAVLYQQHLIELADNFIAMPYLYGRDKVARFDMGNLVMDGRRFNLAVHVHDRAEHIAVARSSNIFTMYVQITGQGVPPFEVAVAVTSGGRGNLVVGKRGIFEDVQGRQLDARVVHIIDNPISLREAIVQPFIRLGRVISGKIESIATSAEKKLDQVGGEAVTRVQSAADQPAPPAAAPAQPQTTPVGGGAGSMVAGGGIAIAAIGSSLAFITKTLAGLKWYAILAGVVGALAAVILPTIIVAWLKLRSRDLSAILEGAGWAINLRMRLTRRQSRFFTERPRYPAGSLGIRRQHWGWIVVIAAVVFTGLFSYEVWRMNRADSEATTPAGQTINQEDPGNTDITNEPNQ